MGTSHIEINLNVLVAKDGDYFIAFSPELQIATQGKTRHEVEKRFHERVTIFVEVAIEKGTLKKRLQELGFFKF